MNERAGYALRIGREKRSRGRPLRSLEREAEVVERAARANRGPLDGRAVRRIFRVIIEESRRLEEGYRDPEGSESPK